MCKISSQLLTSIKTDDLLSQKVTFQKSLKTESNGRGFIVARQTQSATKSIEQKSGKEPIPIPQQPQTTSTISTEEKKSIPEPTIPEKKTEEENLESWLDSVI